MDNVPEVKMDTKIQAKKEFLKLIEDIKLYRREIEKNFIKLGLCLMKIRDKQLYYHHGSKSFSEFIESSGLGISRGWVYQLIAVVKQYKLELNWSDDKLSELGCGKAAVLMRIKDKAKFDTLADRAKFLTLDQLKESVDYAQKGTETEDPYVSLIFKITKTQKESILRILDIVREANIDELGDASLGQVLEMVLADYENERRK